GGDQADEVEGGHGHDRAQGDPGDLEVVGDHQGRVADGDDDAGGHRDQVDRVAEVDPVLLPDLGPQQTDHAVQDHRDAAEPAARGGGDDRADVGGEAEQDRHQRGHVVGGGGVDPGRGHDADVLGVGRGRRPADGRGEGGGTALGRGGHAL